jgi:hypothetical protein
MQRHLYPFHSSTENYRRFYALGRASGLTALFPRPAPAMLVPVPIFRCNPHKSASNSFMLVQFSARVCSGITSLRRRPGGPFVTTRATSQQEPSAGEVRCRFASARKTFQDQAMQVCRHLHAVRLFFGQAGRRPVCDQKERTVWKAGRVEKGRTLGERRPRRASQLSHSFPRPLFGPVPCGLPPISALAR